MDLPQTAHWKAASEKKILSLEKHGDFELIPITSVYTGHKVVGTRPGMMLAIVAKLDNEMHMLDVRTAFLNADVEEDAFIKMAPGYETNKKAGVLLVMKLTKSLYGPRQSPKNWFGAIDVELTVIDFRPLKSDPCVYIYEDETCFAVLKLYVEGILFFSASKTLLSKLKKQLTDRVQISDMGDVSRTSA